MAYQYWQLKEGCAAKKDFLTHTEAYHGDTIGAVSAGGIDLFHKIFRPLLFTTHRIPTPHCYRCPYGLERPSCAMACADKMEEAVRGLAGQARGLHRRAPRTGGGRDAHDARRVSRRLRKVTAECGVLLICDEVATGFGRTGTLFACNQEGVSPDLMSVAKGLTGGYLPLAATFATEEIYAAFLGRYEEFKAFFHGHSYTANPLACAAALATLSIFESEPVIERVAALARTMARELSALRNLPHIGDIRQKGLMAGIEIVADKKTKEPYPPEKKIGQRVVRKVREKGVILRPLGDIIVFMPPLSSTDDEIEHLIRSAAWAMDAVLKEEAANG